MPMATQMDKRHRPGFAALPELRHVRPGVLLTTSAAGLLGIALVVFAVSHILGSEIRNDQLANATRTAELLVLSSLRAQLPSNGRPLSANQLQTLDQAMLTARHTVDIDGVSIWNAHSRVLYSTDHRLIGTTVTAPAEVRTALTGATTAQDRSRVPWSNEAFVGLQTDVAVPIFSAGTGKPIAAADVTIPEASLAQEVSDQTQRIDFVLFGAALLFYAAMLPGLLRASKAVRSESTPRKRALLRELGNAIKRDELILQYQPTVNLAQARVTGVEALLRWRHPKRGLLAPSEFLPTVVDGALNNELAVHVISMAVRNCEAWRERGMDVGVNVNLSVANVLDDVLCEQIGQMLAHAGIPPRALGLEVTEAALTADPERAAGMLRSLDRLGVRVCIDNFGTGYSSLASLRDLPVSELKVDRKFVGGLHVNARDRAIVTLIVRLAHTLNIRVIAEGVEDVETLDDLAEIECDEAQGYFFSAPLTLTELVAWFQTPVAAGYEQLQEPAAHVQEPAEHVGEPAAG
jgi:EAL domain-containing protein (putative c-di-GMP-specific phosphodiesterase class I)